MNPYIDYYVNQAGNGITGYSGARYQRGHGFFGRLFSGAILPALKYLGKQAASTGLNIAEDVLDGENFKKAALKRSIEAGRQSARDAIKRGRTYAQTGKGVKRKIVFQAEIRKPRKKAKKAAKSKRKRNFLD